MPAQDLWESLPETRREFWARRSVPGCVPVHAFIVASFYLAVKYPFTMETIDKSYQICCLFFILGEERLRFNSLFLSNS